MHSPFRTTTSATVKTVSTFLLGAGIMASGLALGGCKETVGPEDSGQSVALSAAGVTAEIVGMLEDAIQDEYRAEQVYLKVMATFGSVRPFSNIVNAERRHASALATLFTRYGLEVPASKWNGENVPTFDSVTEACRAAAEAEVANVALYDEYLSKLLPEDVRIVFENNRRASLEKHLPAFRRCGG